MPIGIADFRAPSTPRQVILEIIPEIALETVLEVALEIILENSPRAMSASSPAAPARLRTGKLRHKTPQMIPELLDEEAALHGHIVETTAISVGDQLPVQVMKHCGRNAGFQTLVSGL